jgi:hypothetical protein
LAPTPFFTTAFAEVLGVDAVCAACSACSLAEDLLDVELGDLDAGDAVVRAGLGALGDAGGLADLARTFAGDAGEVDEQRVDGVDVLAVLTGGIPGESDDRAEETEVHQDGTDPTFALGGHAQRVSVSSAAFVRPLALARDSTSMIFW